MHHLHAILPPFTPLRFITKDTGTADSVSIMVADPYHATLTARREPLFHKTCRTWLQHIYPPTNTSNSTPITISIYVFFFSAYIQTCIARRLKYLWQNASLENTMWSIHIYTTHSTRYSLWGCRCCALVVSFQLAGRRDSGWINIYSIQSVPIEKWLFSRQIRIISTPCIVCVCSFLCCYFFLDSVQVALIFTHCIVVLSCLRESVAFGKRQFYTEWSATDWRADLNGKVRMAKCVCVSAAFVKLCAAKRERIVSSGAAGLQYKKQYDEEFINMN